MKHALLKTALVGLTLAASSAFAAIDPMLIALVPPDTQSMVGLQVDQTQGTPLGQFLLSQLGPNAQLDHFVMATGFDPRRDLKQILITSPGKASGLILGRGIFQTDKLTTAVALGGATKSTYMGIDVFSSKGNAQGMGTVAFLDSSTVLVGDDAMLHSAIDRYRAGTPYRGALAQRANEMSNQYQAWFVSTGIEQLANLGSAPGSPVPMNALQSILEAAGGLKMGADAVTVALDAVTRTDKDAQSLVDVVKFLTSMVQMNRNNDPNSARAAAIVDSASITSSGPVMHLSVAVPEKDLEQMVQQTKPATARPARPAR